MKKLFAISSILFALFLCGCTTTAPQEVPAPEEEPQAQHETYVTRGRYYINSELTGEVVTDDGNIWGYNQTIISQEPAYHNEPVYVCFDDNGTPDDIYDDMIIGLVLDRETAIYDALETALSEEFALERDGNNIRIQHLK